MSKISFLLLLGLFVVLRSHAQETQYGYSLPKKQTIAKIPFELHSNLMIVPVRINKSDTLRFILDTGVSAIILTDHKVAKQCGLVASRDVSIAGAGEGGKLKASVALGNSIYMGEMVGHSQNIVILDQDLLNLSEFVGVPIHGIFGYEIFNRFVVTLDFLTREIILQLPEKYKYHARRGTMRFPLEITDTKPYFTGIGLLEDNQQKAIKVLIDTGAGHSLSLETSTEMPFPLPKRTIKAQLGRGLSGTINGHLGRVREIKVGKTSLKGLIVSYPDSQSISTKLSPKKNRQGSIGCELLRRFRVTFNYSEQFMLLKPIRSKMKEPFEHNMTGMELLAKGKDYKELYISKVAQDSPAETAGLLEGDQLMFINEKNVKRMTLNDVYKLFQRGNDHDVNILVKREQQVFVVSLKLKRLI